MNKKLVGRLACPVCLSELRLTVLDEVGETIVEGSLICGSCGVSYSVCESTPSLLPGDATPLVGQAP